MESGLEHAFAVKGEISVSDLSAETFQQAGLYRQWNGLLIKEPGFKPVFQIDRGLRRGFTSRALFDRIIRGTAAIHEVLDVSVVTDGGAYPDDLTLLGAREIAGIYLLDGGRKRPIPAAALMDLYAFDWGKVHYIPLGALVAIQDGTAIEGRA